MTEMAESTDKEFTGGFVGFIRADGDVTLREGGTMALVAGGNADIKEGGAGFCVVGGDLSVHQGGAGNMIIGGNATERCRGRADGGCRRLSIR